LTNDHYVPGVGPMEHDLMIVGEAPGKLEDESKIPFVGPSGEILNDALRKAGISRHQCYLTNVVKYRPPGNNFKMLHLIGVDLAEQIKNLWEFEIEKFRPKCILAVGNEALKAVTNYDGILNYRGSILLARDGVTKVVPCVHPAALFAHKVFGGDDNGGEEVSGGLDFVYLKLIEHDIRRAVEESHTRAICLPDRDIVVARNSLDLHRYFTQYKDSTDAAVDIESINCIPVCIGFSFTRNHGISIPLLSQIGKHQITSMGYYDLMECWREVDRQLRRIGAIGQNFKYDEFKLSRMGFRIPNVKSDIIIKTRIIFPELPKKSLAMSASLWTRQPYYKDEGKEFKLGKQPIEQLLKYNAMDCCVTKEIDEEQELDLISMEETYGVPARSYYYDYHMKKHKFYLKMENKGFRVDTKRQHELKQKYTFLQDGVHSRLVGLIGHEINVASYPQVFQLLYKEMRFKLRKKDPTSEDSIVALLGNHAKNKEKKETLTVLLEEKRIRTQKSRYINFKPDYDGRCKCSFNIISTETCRSSTSSLKKPLRPGKFGGIPFHTISKHGRLAKDIRSMFIPDEGMVFVQVDASQCQARIVAVLAEDWELLAAFDTVDIHRRTAALIMGMTQGLVLKEGHLKIIDDMDKDDPARFMGKKTRHAGNFAMGAQRFMMEVNTDAQKFDIPLSISGWKAGEMLKLFHSASPKLEHVFWRDIIECIQNTRVLVDPFGGVRVFNGRMDDSTYKEGFANIPQRTEAHLVQQAALATDEELNGDLKDGCWISENHDSLLLQAPANNWEPYAKLLQQNMQKPIDFRTYCSLKRDYTLVIPADIEISDTNYGEMRKVKVA
jgi:uracil-DNA glycosylase family 4